MKTVTIRTAKATLPHLVALTEADDGIVLTRGKVAVAKIVPFHPVVPKRQFGALHGELSVGAEFFDPLPEVELAGWEQ